MFGTESTDPDPIVQRRRTRYLLWGLVAAACLALWIAIWLGQTLVGIGLYWLGVLAFAVVRRRAYAPVQDERDLELARHASMSTVQFAGLALVLGAPGMIALDVADTYAVSSQFEGAMYAYAILFGVFGVAHQFHKRRR
jgi:uncharacterized membrane protein